NGLSGLLMLVNEQEVHFRLIGEFNAYNLLAIYACAVCLGEDRQDVLREMSRLEGAEGRFDQLDSPGGRITGVVDYAHTPDALQNVLATLRKIASSGERIITVVGCGGNRDRAKRPVMGQVAAAHSDRVVFTSDNPRDEDPAEILREMESGVTVTDKRKVIVIADRREAIKTAVSLAAPGDIVLVAGKGHEKYQETRGVRIAFDDRQVLEEMFRMLEK
ncbi:MAG: Mur ligase family protein, partial [bacterium]